MISTIIMILQVKEMTWLPCPLPPQCKVIVTCSRSDVAHKTLSQRDDVKIVSVPLLKDARSKVKVIREYLAIHCKCLDKAQLNHIINCKLSDRPIFLTVLANELRMFGVYSRLDYHLESYLDALSIRDLWSKIILRWVRDYSWSSEQGNKSDSGDNDNGGKVIGQSATDICYGKVLTTLSLLELKCAHRQHAYKHTHTHTHALEHTQATHSNTTRHTHTHSNTHA